MTDSAPKLGTIFCEKYAEFAKNLSEVFPELGESIKTAIGLSDDSKLAAFTKDVYSLLNNPERDTTKCPNYVLPGVNITQELWDSISDGSKKAINDYISLLCFCTSLENGDDVWSKEHMSKFLETWKDKFSGMNIGSIAEKFASMFGMKDTSGGMSGMPKLPEKFLKGHIAKLAEELVRDFKPEDFGFTPEEIQTLEKDPGRAFEIMMRIYTTKPDSIQKSIHKIANRLKTKVMSGAIRPEEIAREAKELMEEFSENPAFVEIMENFKGMFGFEDMDIARKAGREGSARLSMVRNRLKKKLDAKKAAAENSKNGKK
jgi:hypothetical protein